MRDPLNMQQQKLSRNTINVAQIDNGSLDKSAFLTIHLLSKQVTNYYANAYDNEFVRNTNVLENCGQEAQILITP